MHRMLACAAADFQDLRAIGEGGAQYGEYWFLVSLARFGEGQHTGRC
jgi:hypothetical protein